MKIPDDHADAMAYLAERQREVEYEKAVRRIHPAMNATNAAGQQAMWNSANSIGIGMGAVNQAWPQAPLEPRVFMHNTTSFTVEKVDNGFILRSGKYSKVCKDMDELRDLFISIMVEQQLDK
jgi:hypothetical protein